MEIPILEPGEVPLPPDQVRFRSLVVEPYSDGSRVRVKMALTPFLQRPNIDVVLQDPQGAEAGSVTIVESTDAALSVTLHMRNQPQPGEYRVLATLHYPDLGSVHTAEATFTPPHSAVENSG